MLPEDFVASLRCCVCKHILQIKMKSERCGKPNRESRTRAPALKGNVHNSFKKKLFAKLCVDLIESADFLKHLDSDSDNE